MFSEQQSKPQDGSGSSHTLRHHACPSPDLAASSCKQISVTFWTVRTADATSVGGVGVDTVLAKAWQVRDVAAVATSSLVLHFVKIRMILGNMSVFMNTR